MMKTNAPTHEEIARRALEIWHDRGCPSGCDTAIWLDAERQLTAAASAPEGDRPVDFTRSQDIVDPTAAAPADRVEGETAPGHLPENNAPASSPDAVAARATLEKNAARAPQLQHGKNAPKPVPPVSGKPVWDKPHSS